MQWPSAATPTTSKILSNCDFDKTLLLKMSFGPNESYVSFTSAVPTFNFIKDTSLGLLSLLDSFILTKLLAK